MVPTAANRVPDNLCDPEYEVIFRDRLNRRIPSPPKLAELRWGRKVDDVSHASFSYVVSDDNCCDSLGGLEPHAHSVEIRRGKEQVWYGWLDEVDYGLGTVDIQAYDALQWMKQRICRSDFAWVDADQATIFSEVWEDAMAPDPVAAELMLFLTGVLETRSETTGATPRLGWEVVRQMLDSGLDVTVIGQKILVGVIPTAKPIQLRLRDISGGVRVVKKGSQYAGRIIVDANETITAIYPPGPPAANALYPLVEEVVRRGQLETLASAENIAKARYEFSRRVPRQIETDDSIVLKPSLNISLNQLIPGQRLVIDTEGLCYNTKQEFRLGAVDVTVANGEEKISISTQSAASSDALGDAEDPL